MKEQTNEQATTLRPTEAQMNDMHKNEWLDFHADAQEAKKEVNRRYAKMVERFGSYRKMPDGVKDILKDDYAAHKTKWGEQGEEQQKRFGINKAATIPEYKSLADEKEAFLVKMQQNRAQQKTSTVTYEV